MTVPSDSAFAPSYYGTDGDTLFLVTTSDAGLAGEVLAELPVGGAAPLPAGTPRGSAPVPGASPPLVLQSQPMEFPVCVAEPYGRQGVWLMAFDSYYKVPVPAQFLLLRHLQGETMTLFEVGPLVRFLYRATLFGGQEELLFQAIAPAGGQALAPPIQFPVQHCLGGTWQDADRILRIYQDLSQVTADVESGTLCDEAGGVAFTGVLLPADDHFSGSDLKACNPDECVSAGLLDPTTVADYQATIALDGNSVQIDWGSVQFDYVYDGGGNLTACTPNGDVQPRSFSITRNTFGPGVP